MGFLIRGSCEILWGIFRNFFGISDLALFLLLILILDQFLSNFGDDLGDYLSHS